MVGSSVSVVQAANEYFDALVKSRFIEMFDSAHYTMCSLSEVCEITDGSHYSPKEMPDGMFPMLSVKDMTDSGFDYSNAKLIDQQTYGDLVKSGCQPKSGDVLIAKDGATAFQKGFVLNNSKPQVLLSSIAIIRPNRAILNSTFLLYYLFSDEVRKDVLRKRISGSAITRIVLKDFKSINVKMPPIELQNQFADFVRQVDKSKLLFQQMVSKYDELVKSRFIEMFGSNEKVTLTELASITMGQSPNSSSYNDEGRGVPFFQGKTEFGDTFVSVNLYCDAPKKMAKSMDILMSVRAPVGSVNITPVDCCIGRGLAAISPISNVTNVWFLFHALKLMEKEIESMGVGSTFKAINKSNINEIKVPLAPIELQNQFADFVRQVDKSKSEILEGIKRLKSNRITDNEPNSGS